MLRGLSPWVTSPEPRSQNTESGEVHEHRLGRQQKTVPHIRRDHLSDYSDEACACNFGLCPVVGTEISKKRPDSSSLSNFEEHGRLWQFQLQLLVRSWDHKVGFHFAAASASDHCSFFLFSRCCNPVLLDLGYFGYQLHHGGLTPALRAPGALQDDYYQFMTEPFSTHDNPANSWLRYAHKKNTSPPRLKPRTLTPKPKKAGRCLNKTLSVCTHGFRSAASGFAVLRLHEQESSLQL